MQLVCVVHIGLGQALIHGLNRHYYSLCISYRKNELEEKMLMNLNRKKWSHGLNLRDFADVDKKTSDVLKVTCQHAICRCCRVYLRFARLRSTLLPLFVGGWHVAGHGTISGRLPETYR